MKLVVKEYIHDYKDLDELYDTSIGLQPVLEFDADTLGNEYASGKLLSTKLVRSLCSDFLRLNKDTIDEALTDRVRLHSIEQLCEFFPMPLFDFEDADTKKHWSFLNGYEVYVYPSSKYNLNYPMPSAREAMYSKIFIRNNIMNYNYNNVYKNYEWNELLKDLCDLPVYTFSDSRSEDCSEYGDDIYSFVLITDNEFRNGVTNIFNSTIAGCLTNKEARTKIIFNKVQSVCIYALLHSLCQKFYDACDDDNICEHNPYVSKFYELCRQLEDPATAQKLVENIMYTAY